MWTIIFLPLDKNHTLAVSCQVCVVSVSLLCLSKRLCSEKEMIYKFYVGKYLFLSFNVLDIQFLTQTPNAFVNISLKKLYCHVSYLNWPMSCDIMSHKCNPLDTRVLRITLEQLLTTTQYTTELYVISLLHE